MYLPSARKRRKKRTAKVRTRASEMIKTIKNMKSKRKANKRLWHRIETGIAMHCDRSYKSAETLTLLPLPGRLHEVQNRESWREDKRK
jgi:hypothetical protein